MYWINKSTNFLLIIYIFIGTIMKILIPIKKITFLNILFLHKPYVEINFIFDSYQSLIKNRKIYFYYDLKSFSLFLLILENLIVNLVEILDKN